MCFPKQRTTGGERQTDAGQICTGRAATASIVEELVSIVEELVSITPASKFNGQPCSTSNF